MKRERIGRITAELSALVHEVVGEHMDTVEDSATSHITLGRIQAINDILEKLDETFKAEER